jgi:hypothetical protein
MSGNLPPVVGSGTPTDPVVLPDVNVTAPNVTPTANAAPPGYYAERRLDFVFTLGKGSFGSSGFNTVKVTGLRSNVAIAMASAPGLSTCVGMIQGLTPDIMNSLSTLGTPADQYRNNNEVTIYAGDGGNGAPVVFNGLLRVCYQDFNAQPETALHFRASPMTAAGFAPLPPLSFPGGADVATMMAQIAKMLGLNFENNNVQVKLSNQYLAGTPLQQARDLAEAAGIFMHIDPQTKTLAIWPQNGVRAGGTPLISPDSGLIGYPTYSDSGISFRCLYNPTIKFGGQVQIKNATDPATGKSVLPTTDGIWTVWQLFVDLSCQIHNGPWFSEVSCLPVSVAPVTPS